MSKVASYLSQSPLSVSLSFLLFYSLLFPAKPCLQAPDTNSSISEIPTFSSSGTLLPHFYFLSSPLYKINHFLFSKLIFLFGSESGSRSFNWIRLHPFPQISFFHHALTVSLNLPFIYYSPEFCRWFSLPSFESARRICWGTFNFGTSRDSLGIALAFFSLYFRQRCAFVFVSRGVVCFFFFFTARLLRSRRID